MGDYPQQNIITCKECGGDFEQRTQTIISINGDLCSDCLKKKIGRCPIDGERCGVCL